MRELLGCVVRVNYVRNDCDRQQGEKAFNTIPRCSAIYCIICT